MKRRSRQIGIFALAALIGGGALLYGLVRIPPEAVAMTVYMTPECGCCGDWVAHMKQSGFLVTGRYLSEAALWGLKDYHEIPDSTRSCHTAEVRGYVVEGHIPADAVRRILRDRLDILGAAVPGMPLGSPGMEVPGQQPHPYDVVAIHRDGELSVLERR
jgi:hypothetical protein